MRIEKYNNPTSKYPWIKNCTKKLILIAELIYYKWLKDLTNCEKYISFEKERFNKCTKICLYKNEN